MPNIKVTIELEYPFVSVDYEDFGVETLEEAIEYEGRLLNVDDDERLFAFFNWLDETRAKFSAIATVTKG